MKRLFNIAGHIEHNISYWHLAIFLAMLPFDFFYSQLVLVSFAAHTLIHLRKERLRLLLAKPVGVVVAVYLLGFVGMLYSHDKAAAWDLAGRQSAILIWPVLLTLTNFPLAQYTERLLHFFAAVCVATILYLYVDAFRIIFYYHLPLKNIFSQAFMNHQFSLPIGIHATYISLYAALSFVVLLQGLFSVPSGKMKLLYAIGLAILAAGLLQLSSRAVCIALLVIVNTIFPWMALQGKKRWWFWGASLLLTLAAGLFINNTAAFKTRYFTELRQDVTDTRKVDYDVTEPRMERWKLAWQLVRQQPLMGHGSGSELRLLKDTYFEHQLYSSYINAFNAHSQYLSFLIKTGIAGLLVYLYVVGYGTWVAIRRKQLYFAAFLLLVIIVSVGENILDVNKGIFFYGFFMSLFLLPMAKPDEATQ
jgi:O-antigen ligase